jgi:hypothetical protein
MQKLGGRGKPKGKGWEVKKLCSTRKEVAIEWRTYKMKGFISYIRKIGKIGDPFPYQIYVRKMTDCILLN